MTLGKIVVKVCMQLTDKTGLCWSKKDTEAPPVINMDLICLAFLIEKREGNIIRDVIYDLYEASSDAFLLKMQQN